MTRLGPEKAGEMTIRPPHRRGPQEKAYVGEAQGARLNEESEGSECRLQKA